MDTSRTLLQLLVLIIALTCGSRLSAEPPPNEEMSEAVLLVRDETSEVIDHATVHFVTSKGVQDVGRASELAKLLIPEDLLAKGEGAVLVCAEGYYCGGWLAGDPALTSLRGAENPFLSITLSAIRLH